MKAICKALRNNTYIRSLSLAFNPVSKEDDVKELGYFIRNNAKL